MNALAKVPKRAFRARLVDTPNAVAVIAFLWAKDGMMRALF
jgi:hypothetical protein